jgi:hypothetical protein
MEYRIGDRVRVRRSHPWARGVTGTVTSPYDPDMTHILSPRPYRVGRTPGGEVRFYSVEFDRPLDDGNGIGPYEGAEFPEDQLRPVVL